MNLKKSLIEIITLIIVVLTIRLFIISPYVIHGESMLPNYKNSEYILVNKFLYLFKSPQRWDVVVTTPHSIEWKDFFIKRIIGLPWEKIKIEGWYVYLFNKDSLNYTKLNEEYLWKYYWKTYVNWSPSAHEYIIPNNKYFLLWDNRLNSTDSRNCFLTCSEKNNFTLDKSDIIWKIFLVNNNFKLEKRIFTNQNSWDNY